MTTTTLYASPNAAPADEGSFPSYHHCRVVTRDAFGCHLAELLGRAAVGAESDPADALGDTSMVVLAALRPDPDIAERLARTAWLMGVPLLPVTFEGSHLVAGPYVVPGRSGCLSCYRRRVRQHDPAAKSSAQLSAAYRSDPLLQPGGWLPALAYLCAGLVAATLDGTPGGLRPGEIRVLDVLTLLPSSGFLVGYTGCTVCDETTTADRSWVDLAAEWPSLLGGGR